MRLTIAYSKIKKRNLVLINNDTHQRETVSERPIRPPLSYSWLAIKGVEGSDCKPRIREKLILQRLWSSKKYYHFTKMVILTFTLIITFLVLPKFWVYQIIEPGMFPQSWNGELTWKELPQETGTIIRFFVAIGLWKIWYWCVSTDSSIG